MLQVSVMEAHRNLLVLDGSQSWCGVPGRGVMGFRLSVAALEAEGVPALLEAAASGQLQQRYRFISAAATDLRVV